MNTKTKQTHPSRIFPGTIPDLWEIAHLPELKGYTLGGVSARDLILDTWHLCHKFQDHNEKLLEALRGLLSLGDNENLYEEWKAEFTAAEEAIAAATGETL